MASHDVEVRRAHRGAAAPPRGRSVLETMRAHQPELVDAILRALVEEFPPFAHLPDEYVQGEARAATQRALGLFASFLESGVLSADDLQELADSATRRAEEGAPLSGVLGAYFHGTARCTSILLSEQSMATPLEVRLRCVDGIIRFLEQIVTAVATGFENHARTARSEQDALRQSLLEALLRGDDVRELAAMAGVSLPEQIVVVELQLDQHPDERSAEPGSTMARERKIRRARDVLLESLGGDIIWRPHASGGLALLPGHAVDRLDHVHRDIETSTGVRAVVAFATSGAEGLGEAYRLAGEILTLAQRRGTTSGVVGLDDVAVEFQMARTTSASPLLAARIRVLEQHPDLLVTLEHYIEQEMNRQRTASVAGVHPRTVDNRLRRIADLTGLDPTSPGSWLQLSAAVSARRALQT